MLDHVFSSIGKQTTAIMVSTKQPLSAGDQVSHQAIIQRKIIATKTTIRTSVDATVQNPTTASIVRATPSHALLDHVHKPNREGLDASRNTLVELLPKVSAFPK